MQEKGSLYADYIKEREGYETVEDARGFATYSYLRDTVYIRDVFVSPEFRRQNVATELVDKIAAIAKTHGFNKIMVTVAPRAKGATNSLKATLGQGFHIDSSDNELVYFIKEIE